MNKSATAILSSALRERGLRATPQRLGIARLLEERPGHVTAERVHDDLTQRLPGVSLPTVYATLELLDELGLVRRVPTEGTFVYDTRTHDHHHLVCKRCGAIADVDARVDRRAVMAAAVASGFAADDAQVVVRGLCAACAATDAG